MTDIIALPPWLDPKRNPKVVENVSFDLLAVAPHAFTKKDNPRWAYIVPNGKFTHVFNIKARVVRGTSNTGGKALFRIVLTLDPNDIDFFELGGYGDLVNSAGSYFHDSYGEIDLYPGQRVICQSEDQSTGGAVDYNVTMFAIEYDQIP